MCETKDTIKHRKCNTIRTCANSNTMIRGIYDIRGKNENLYRAIKKKMVTNFNNRMLCVVPSVRPINDAFELKQYVKSEQKNIPRDVETMWSTCQTLKSKYYVLSANVTVQKILEGHNKKYVMDYCGKNEEEVGSIFDKYANVVICRNQRKFLKKDFLDLYRMSKDKDSGNMIKWLILLSLIYTSLKDKNCIFNINLKNLKVCTFGTRISILYLEQVLAIEEIHIFLVDFVKNIMKNELQNVPFSDDFIATMPSFIAYLVNLKQWHKYTFNAFGKNEKNVEKTNKNY